MVDSNNIDGDATIILNSLTTGRIPIPKIKCLEVTTPVWLTYEPVLLASSWLLFYTHHCYNIHHYSWKNRGKVLLHFTKLDQNRKYATRMFNCTHITQSQFFNLKNFTQTSTVTQQRTLCVSRLTMSTLIGWLVIVTFHTVY